MISNELKLASTGTETGEKQRLENLRSLLYQNGKGVCGSVKNEVKVGMITAAQGKLRQSGIIKQNFDNSDFKQSEFKQPNLSNLNLTMKIRFLCRFSIIFDQCLIKNVKICPIFDSNQFYWKMIKKSKNWSECQLKIKKVKINQLFDWFWPFLIKLDHFLLIKIICFNLIWTALNQICCNDSKSGFRFLTDFQLKSERITKILKPKPKSI